MLFQRFADGFVSLVNSITGLGGAGTKSLGGNWTFNHLDPVTAIAAYRSSWMVRKAIDIPVFDAMREGWSWKTDEENIRLLEAEEKKHRITEKLVYVQTWARLFGGAAILIGDGSSNVTEELDPERIGKQGLKYLIPLDRYSINAAELEFDPESEWFMRHRSYGITWNNGKNIEGIHPSRVAIFNGPAKPGIMGLQEDGWGDSTLQHILSDIEIAMSSHRGIAELVQEAKVDVFRIPGLTDRITTKEYEDRMLKRFNLANRAKSVVNALMLDKDEEYTQKSVQFERLPEIQLIMLQIVSAAADIPVTRFLAQSPAGLNATGESDIRNYYDRVSAQQEMFLRPAMQPVMDALAASAIGRLPEDIWFDFEPLWQMSEKELAEVEKTQAETDGILSDKGLVPDYVIDRIVRNRLIESGSRPGVEEAYEEWDKGVSAEGEPIELEPEPVDPSQALPEGKGGVAPNAPSPQVARTEPKA